jgi:hypothetical protein
MSATCLTCRHWDGVRDHDRLFYARPAACLRATPFVGPPRFDYGGSDLGTAVWPITRPEDRCGEHAPVETLHSPDAR